MSIIVRSRIKEHLFGKVNWTKLEYNNCKFFRLHHLPIENRRITNGITANLEIKRCERKINIKVGIKLVFIGRNKRKRLWNWQSKHKAR